MEGALLLGDEGALIEILTVALAAGLAALRDIEEGVEAEPTADLGGLVGVFMIPVRARPHIVTKIKLYNPPFAKKNSG